MLQSQMNSSFGNSSNFTAVAQIWNLISFSNEKISLAGIMEGSNTEREQAAEINAVKMQEYSASLEKKKKINSNTEHIWFI